MNTYVYVLQIYFKNDDILSYVYNTIYQIRVTINSKMFKLKKLLLVCSVIVKFRRSLRN